MQKLSDIFTLSDSDLFKYHSPSQEDNVFEKEAQSGIQHVDGHYMFPLLFREHDIQMH